VTEQLLNGIGRGFVPGLGFDYGEWKVAGEAQQVINALGWFANETLANRDDTAIRDGALSIE
jgi:hypothetical protein